MRYNNYNRQRRTRSDGNKWILPVAFIILTLWFITSSIRGISPTEFLSNAYCWVVGKKSPNKSREELKTVLLNKEFQIDSLASLVDEFNHTSPYRIAIVKTSANSLNLRAQPDLSSDVVIKIPNSSTVKILYFNEEVLVLDGETGNWCKVKFVDKEGWVWGNYLELQD